MISSMAVGARRRGGDFTAGGARSLTVSTVVGVESAQGDVWRAQVTYVSDRLVGLRGWTIVDGRFRERDTVTLLIGDGDRLVSGKAQVLAAGGSLMRIVRRDASEESERRLAPRLRVDIDATVTVSTPQAGLTQFATQVVDLSASGLRDPCDHLAARRHADRARPRARGYGGEVRRHRRAHVGGRERVARRCAVRSDAVADDPAAEPLPRRSVAKQRVTRSAPENALEENVGAAEILCDAHELGARADAELLQDTRTACLDGTETDAAQRRDLRVRVPEHEVVQDLALLVGQRVDARLRRGRGRVTRALGALSAVDRRPATVAARTEHPAQRCADR